LADNERSSKQHTSNNDYEALLTKQRKMEHIEICLDEDVQYSIPTMFNDIEFIHNALPEIDKDAIDLTTNFLGLRASAPIIIAGMTGGHPDTLAINKRLAQAAELLRLPIGVGSQRSAIENPELADTFRIVRDEAPSVPIIANIGATHVESALQAIEMIEADVVAIHLNPLQEAVQPEGDCNSIGVLDKIADIVDSVEVPVIIKETGAGISAGVATQLESIGVDAIDCGGAGGTSWSAVEYYRALKEEDEIHSYLGKIFWDWGIPTALSVIMILDSTDLDVVATGGIRTGIDVAKAVGIGAMAAGVAIPLLRAAVHGTTEDVVYELNKLIEGLRVTMYLTGCNTIDDLVSRPLIIKGELAESLNSLGIDYTRLAGGVE
jgi:isopentenyl-diphosphate delta-isomerase